MGRRSFSRSLSVPLQKSTASPTIPITRAIIFSSCVICGQQSQKYIARSIEHLIGVPVSEIWNLYQHCNYQQALLFWFIQGKDHIANMMIDKIGYVGNTIMIIVRKVRLLKEQDYSVVASSLSCGVVEISV
jgi:hypothetical protein